MLEVCKKEYQKLYLEHENLKNKKKKRKYEEQQEELLRYRSHYKRGLTAKKTPQYRKIKLSIIKFDEEKLRNLLSATQIWKPGKRRYYNNIYSDDGMESDNEFSENDGESSEEKIVKKKKKTQARKRTV